MKSIENNIPIYINIGKELKNRIVTGKIKPNEKMPSVRNLALEYNINPNTALKTLDLLEQEGYIHTDSTNGKFVTSDEQFINRMRIEILNEHVTYFINELASLGYSLSEVLDILKEKVKVK